MKDKVSVKKKTPLFMNKFEEINNKLKRRIFLCQFLNINSSKQLFWGKIIIKNKKTINRCTVERKRKESNGGDTLDVSQGMRRIDKVMILKVIIICSCK